MLVLRYKHTKASKAGHDVPFNTLQEEKSRTKYIRGWTCFVQMVLTAAVAPYPKFPILLDNKVKKMALALVKRLSSLDLQGLDKKTNAKVQAMLHKFFIKLVSTSVPDAAEQNNVCLLQRYAAIVSIDVTVDKTTGYQSYRLRDPRELTVLLQHFHFCFRMVIAKQCFMGEDGFKK